MATLSNILQSAVLADFAKDSTLSKYPLRAREYGGTKAGDDIYPDSKEQSLVVVTVSVSNQGELKYGTSIYRLIVEATVIYNGSADNFDGQLVDDVAKAASDRLQPSTNLAPVGREQQFSGTFSGGAVKVFGIVADQPTRHGQSGFQRTRTVARTFIACQPSGPVL